MYSQKKQVAEKLRHYREASVLSQKQVADALNIERSTYTKYETGDSEPSLNTLVKIAGIFNVSPMQLLPTESSSEARPYRTKDTSGADSPIYQLSKEERGLIALFRGIDKTTKQEAKVMMINLSKKEK